MKTIEEFKKFIFRGNVVDLAIGMVIGTASGKLAASLVENVLMPLIGYLTGKTDFSGLKIVLKNGIELNEVTIKYGSFIQDTVGFLIIAFCISFLMKAPNMLYKKERISIPFAEECLLTEIRDLLKSKF